MIRVDTNLKKFMHERVYGLLEMTKPVTIYPVTQSICFSVFLFPIKTWFKTDEA